MKISDIYAELRRRNRLLAYTGLAHLLLLLLFAGLSLIDQRTVLGINTWIKPAKFAMSICIYLWTLGWLLHYLPRSRRWARLIGTGTAAVLSAEMVLITLQAARGVRSHFNVETPLDGAIFSLMGILILVNTLLFVCLTVLFFVRRPALPPAYLLGIRAGMLLFLFASGVGGLMVRQMAHSVGVADGGAGLPLLNWSTEGGDLRIAHFMGLHALQVLPFLAYYLQKKQPRYPQLQIMVCVTLYTALVVFLCWQALSGSPFPEGLHF